ncbi:hypothetical protein IGI04_036090 [Brassica rapa subsp. trilocularis]|uniref:Uncharacterized protein n=1 Tax=Brassica rapa subsp. trilocularis TaxID=1813537 RepID=A0ABQ7LFD2_BRACM|nr:hypothetical protein IGI04_036090 [Brassica rapa subsp. trilocularis]
MLIISYAWLSNRANTRQELQVQLQEHAKFMCFAIDRYGEDYIDRFSASNIDRYGEDYIDRFVVRIDSTIDAKVDQPGNYTHLLAWFGIHRIGFFRQVWKSSKRDLEAAIFKARFHKEFLDIGQKEVNRAWWQPPLSFDSWKPVQSWSLILQWKQTLTQERN